MLTFLGVINNDAENEQYLISNENDIRYLSSILSTINYRRGLYLFFEEQNLPKAKQHFYVCGLLDAFRIKTYQDRMFDYDLHSIGYAMLSDNLPFVKEVFSTLTYHSTYLEDGTEKEMPISMEDNVLDGEGAIFTHTVQQFLLGNNALIERNLELMEKKYFSKKNENSTMQYDVNFFKALYKKDQTLCESILKEMVSPKIHQKRNDDALLKKYISMPALGYAKLAWIMGMEVQIKSKLIPMELLPIQPLENYEIPYDFLK
ncbi:MAG: hypothetical protein C4K58_04460 [Flavobacteriaceae bacterium]|nr:MAG: hypothetical protein C4K58_04460 [Flavobacteriaceae bacterium]